MPNTLTVAPIPQPLNEEQTPLLQLDRIRLETSAKLDRKRRSQLGQFMTPSTVAQFMASLFTESGLLSASLLDAGAGIGSLSSAFLERWRAGGFGFKRVSATAYEIDPILRNQLAETLGCYAGKNFAVNIEDSDFIEDSVFLLGFGKGISFTHAILNPPYKKILSNSSHRLMLRKAGIETVNLYSAFVALAMARMMPGGQVVAIIPRSFCNGPYYKPFREFILSRAAVRRIHLFTARDKAFKDDDVLQENIIISLERGGEQGPVTVSTSNDDSFSDFASFSIPFDQIVKPGDNEGFIHIPVSSDPEPLALPSSVCHSLADLGIEVSTGPVVDFRLKPHLVPMPVSGAVPLLYPCHFSGQVTEWPKADSKKPNAIMVNKETRGWLFPNGFYTIVRRFSSKEEKRRIVASVVSPDLFDAEVLGFENHLNVYHQAKAGLCKELVHGLAVFLNSSHIDAFFRRFSGHTQVNATDLRILKYPSVAQLKAIGRWALSRSETSQEDIDHKIDTLP